MKLIGVCVLFVAVSVVASATVVGQDAAKGATLLAEARRALGGEEKLRNIKTLDVRGDFKRAAGQMALEGELQVRLEVPGKLRRDEDFSLPGGRPPVLRTEVLNGSTVWDDVTGGGGAFVGRFGRGDQGGEGHRRRRAVVARRSTQRNSKRRSAVPGRPTSRASCSRGCSPLTATCRGSPQRNHPRVRPT